MAGETFRAVLIKWLRIFSIGRRPKWTMIRLAVLITLTFGTYEFVFLPVQVVGISMEPTYHNRSLNLLNRLSYVGGKEPRRGDIVGIRMTGEHAVLLKRVVGLPGERLAFHQGIVWINGTPIEEPYLKLPHRWETAEEYVRPDHYYFVGDNRSMDVEYHEHGSALRSQIIGKVVIAGNP